MGAPKWFNRRAVKQLERARRNPSGWTNERLGKMLTKFGFLRHERGNHTMYYDAEDKDNFVMVPRHRQIRDYVVREAVSCVDKTLQRWGVNYD